MALTRKMMTAMGIEPEKIDQIIEAHSETVNGLKEQAKEIQAIADKVPDLEKKIGELESAQPTDDWEAKYNELKTEHEAYQAKVEQERADNEKASLYRGILRDLGIDEKRVAAIMRVTDLSDVKVEDGAISDRESVEAKVKAEWDAFIPQVETKGAEVPTPPENESKQSGADPQVVKRLQERHERLYGKSESKEQ